MVRRVSRSRPELQRIARSTARWFDRHALTAWERNDCLARFPCLAADFFLLPRQRDVGGWRSDIPMFNITSAMTFGSTDSSSNAMAPAVQRLDPGSVQGRP
jgi:hypothetical protein